MERSTHSYFPAHMHPKKLDKGQLIYFTKNGKIYPFPYFFLVQAPREWGVEDSN